MYLLGSLLRLERDINCARQGFCFAAKVVRGAYLNGERTRAQELGLADPIVTTKDAVDVQYNAAVEMMIRGIKKSMSSEDEAPKLAILIATHNHESVLRAANLIDVLELPRNHLTIHFAQIMGMSENLTEGMGSAGFNSNKLVLFGEFHEILPWLLRRVDENSDFLSAMADQRHLLWVEVKRRLLAALGLD